MGSTPFRILVTSIMLALWPFAAAASFHLQEATIADIHHAILAKELTATELVGLYLKRITAYNGQCVAGAGDANGYLLGDIEPIEKAGKVGALVTLNIRGKRSKTDTVDTARFWRQSFGDRPASRHDGGRTRPECPREINAAS